MTDTPVVLSYGMGVESTAILLRWLTEPASRDFTFDNLTVVTAMTGDEFPETGTLVTDHILPRLRAAGVRYVQLARGGPVEADGVAILDDSRAPNRMHMRGAWALSDELLGAGTIPQIASGRRLCSTKFKGWPIDQWVADDIGDRPFRHVIGYNCDEGKRVTRDQLYATTTRLAEYPLMTWGWDRACCDAYISEITGAAWVKSCCTYCPFAHDNHLDRYQRYPEAGAAAMMLEHRAVALNPLTPLFGKKSVIDLIVGDGNQAAIDLFRGAVDAIESWAVFEVRRILFASRKDPTAKGTSARSIRKLYVGELGDASRELHLLAGGRGVTAVTDGHGTLRASIRRRRDTYPTVEHFLAIAPSAIADKQRTSFEKSWATYSTLPEPENPTPTLFDLLENVI